MLIKPILFDKEKVVILELTLAETKSLEKLRRRMINVDFFLKVVQIYELIYYKKSFLLWLKNFHRYLVSLENDESQRSTPSILRSSLFLTSRYEVKNLYWPFPSLL